MIDESWYRRPEGVGEHVSAGGIVVRSEYGRLLLALVHEAGHDSFVLPKGHVDAGEDTEEAARREIAEEAGLTDLRLVADLGVRERLNFARTSWKKTRYYLFLTDQVSGTPRDLKHTHSADWFPLDALPPLYWPEQAELIQTHAGEIAQLARSQP
jgi:ADP-ribose pyrophosphatase YjhB (NUDIX family)